MLSWTHTSPICDVSLGHWVSNLLEMKRGCSCLTPTLTFDIGWTRYHCSIEEGGYSSHTIYLTRVYRTGEIKIQCMILMWLSA